MNPEKLETLVATFEGLQAKMVEQQRLINQLGVYIDLAKQGIGQDECVALQYVPTKLTDAQTRAARRQAWRREPDPWIFRGTSGAPRIRQFNVAILDSGEERVLDPPILADWAR